MPLVSIQILHLSVFAIKVSQGMGNNVTVRNIRAELSPQVLSESPHACNYTEHPRLDINGLRKAGP